MTAECSFHRLSEQCFTELGRGSGGASSVAELRSGQRSRTMLLLRALVGIASGHPALPGPLPDVREPWRLLIRAERTAPAAVERILLHPQAGAWLNRCLRRLRGRESVKTPLWAETGYLYAMAASAALLAGIDFRITVAVREGGVMLPALGFARLPDRTAETAEVVRTPEGKTTVTAGRHTVPLPFDLTGNAPGWYGLRRLRGEHQGLICAPFLDDVDPYRDFLRTTPPERLDDDEWKHWRTCFDAAWRLVAEQAQVDPRGIAACLGSLVPVPYTAHPDLFSASSPEAHGCVLLGRPADPLTLAASLVHEAQHTKLSALMDLVPLIEGGLEEIHYAPWRLDPRPLRGLLHGVYAFLGVTGFWQDRWHRAEAGPARDTAAFEFALRRAQTARGLRTLLAHARLTPLGERFLRLAGERLAGWLAEPVPPLPRRWAADVLLDAELVYRLRHLQPDSVQIRHWARARRLGTAPPRALPVTSVRAAPTATPPRPALVRHRLMEPVMFTRLHRDRDALLPDGTAPDAADLDWAADRPGAALDGYRARLEKSPDDLSAWAGLALSMPDGTARQALLSRPELVLAVHRALRDTGTAHPGPGPDPLALAEWIGTHAPP
ncbi:HEXXH motif domain-containing protein [Streptomyces sp. NA02950]|uniref:HEXXH motif domain-containing protein n=1 Tax=Streptomyces sp. NA02950 TaxID=2742137 RepID=UPI0015923E17|nr:HEXXH motif domain-containing protein [Streptomyces sp. NA02950]QKV91088.1 HEXXH motif domain-containing protein [Streptomyces sp. NA02950]